MLACYKRVIGTAIFLLLFGILPADGILDHLIIDEYENIANRTSIDYDTKVTQAWRDSSWINKYKKVKTYDNSGYLTQKESYRYDDGDWRQRGLTVIENNLDGSPVILTRQVHRNENWMNRSRVDYVYGDNGFLLEKSEQKWFGGEWRKKKKFSLEYEGELCQNRTLSRWRDSTWVDRGFNEFNYDDSGNRTERIVYKWRDSTWVQRHRAVLSFNNNNMVSGKLFYVWRDSLWIDKARISVTYDNNMNPYQVLFEKKDSTGSWMNISVKENNYSADGQLLETVQSRWSDGAWLPRRRFEYSYATGRGVTALGISVAVPKNIAISKAYPNPFNPATTISYELLESNHVRVDIYDMAGRKVRTLVNQNQGAGNWSIRWNALNDRGQTVAAGMYFYKIESGGELKSNKIVLLK
tara:strand:+ start:2891 stop:4120 length:1230 start_codon:yes stop_codon:yes gene_type:complete